MEVRLLGPLQVVDDRGQPVVISPPRPKAILAVLALRAGRPITTAELVTALWGRQPPATARESIHYFIYRLRKSLGRAAIRTQDASYQLQVSPAQIDVARFERLVDQAHAAFAHGELDVAWERFAQALGLWRGLALADFDTEPFVAPERARLEERRVAAVEGQLRVGLALGRHAQLAGDLEALVTEHPLREELWELLMLARYRTGRQAAALDAYQQARRILLDHGLTPGNRLQRLQRAILTHDPALDLPDQQPVLLQPPAQSPDQAPPSRLGPDEPPTSTPTAATADAASREERRTVTVLVVGVGGLRGDPEDARAQVATLTQQTNDLVSRYGGVVQPGTPGRLLVVFGADRSREDDPERAVRAALDLCAHTNIAGWPITVGIATGQAVVTLPVEDDAAAGSQHVDAAGVLHTAAALQASAPPGRVLAAATTYWATSQAITYRPAAPAPTQGGAITLDAWEAIAPRARTGAHLGGGAATPLVERDRELAILDDVLSRFLRNREPQLLTVVSEPGLGKTRLVDELSRLVDQRPELVSWRIGRTPPYGGGAVGALTEIVKAHVGILDGDDVATTARKLEQTVDGLGGALDATVTAALQTLLGAGTSEQLTNQRLFDAWTRFLGAVANDRPLVVVVEDLQWADDTLLDFLEELPERVGWVPLLVVATGRLEVLDRRPGWGGGKRNALTLTLSPLSRAGTGRLLDALLADRLLDANTRRAVLEASGGNPLYVEEYAWMLRHGGSDVPPSASALPIPSTVRQVIAARIDTLPVADKQLLQDAAVLGQVGWVGALAAVSGRDPGQVQEWLARMVRRAFLRRVRAASVAGETEYAFRHTLIREVAYGQVLRAERAGKHQRMAGWIQSLSPDPGDRAELLAHHYGRALELARAAGQPTQALAERARGVFKLAGDHAARLGSFVAAARDYRAALALWPEDDPARAELLLGLGQALVYGEHAGEAVIKQAREAAQSCGREDLVVEADALLALLARVQGDWAGAEQRTRQRLDGSSGQEPTPEILSALGNRAIHLQLSSRHAEVITTATQLVALARRHGRPEHEGNGLHLIGEARILTGDPGGLVEIEQGAALMEAHRFPLRVHASWGRALAFWWYGDLERCAAAVTAGRQLAETTGAAIACWFGSLEAALAYANGRWDDAVATANRTLTQSPLGTRGQAACLIVRGSVALARGHLDSALADARAAVQVSAPADPRYRQAALALEGRCLLATGEREQTIACLEHLLAAQRKRPAEACATPDEATLMLDLDYPSDALPDGLAPTRWHQAVQALVERDFHGALKLLTTIGSHVDVDAVLARLQQT